MTARFWKRLEKHLAEVEAERTRHLDKWGEQSLELHSFNELGMHSLQVQLDSARYLNDYAGGGYDWYTVLHEEMLEAFTETDPRKQREEFIQVAAVALAIVNDLDRKSEEDAA